MKLFRMSSFQTLLGFSLIALLIGCDREPETHRISGDVKTRLPVVSEGGPYGLQEVTLQGITSLYELGGQFAKFYIYPSVSGSKIYGQQPKTRFLKAGDVFVPQDELTQQMAVIYYHLQNLATLDVEAGAAEVNTWPREVGISVRYRKKGGFDYNNAFYDGSIDAILVVPYTQNNLPIAVNAGILAHEHFHSLYYKLVEKNIFGERSKPLHGKEIREEVLGSGIVDGHSIEITKVDSVDGYSEQYHRLFSRGVNEGLADFWAWIYTGDPDFLQLSLPSEKTARSLNLDAKEEATYKFPNSADWSAQIANARSETGADGKKNLCRGDRVAYCLGTEYARTLKRFASVVASSRQLAPFEARKFVGRAVVKSLPALKAGILRYKENEFFKPESYFTMIRDSIDGINDQEKNFLETIVTNASKRNKTPYAEKASILPAPLFPEGGVR